jgi:hypothetical protein
MPCGAAAIAAFHSRMGCDIGALRCAPAHATDLLRGESSRCLGRKLQFKFDARFTGDGETGALIEPSRWVVTAKSAPALTSPTTKSCSSNAVWRSPPSGPPADQRTAARSNGDHDVVRVVHSSSRISVVPAWTGSLVATIGMTRGTAPTSRHQNDLYPEAKDDGAGDDEKAARQYLAL